MAEESLGESTPPISVNQITVVDKIYHRQGSESPTSVSSRFIRHLQTDEQVYERRTRVGEEWTPLEHGWIEEAGMIVIQNTEGTTLQVIPTEEEKEETAAKILELSVTDGLLDSPPGVLAKPWLIPPGESFRGYPSDVSKLVLRCRSGVCRYNVHVYPR